MGFDALVQQYAALMAEIDNKKWALSELRQTQDDDLGDLWNQRWSGTAVQLFLFDPWTDVCKIGFGITSKKQMTNPKICQVDRTTKISTNNTAPSWIEAGKMRNSFSHIASFNPPAASPLPRSDRKNRQQRRLPYLTNV